MGFHDDPDPEETARLERSRRDLVGLVLLAAVAAVLIVIALAVGGGVAGD